eukprot:TRINITY_DN19982_c0_g1_i1.p1 TRINITY_DN19982_c0_g1~~TRINITY_DN19982_c0_g1_i1.p1  ORF type:complete len:122 (-),score=2.74 TRINITY_DN19982_c0_g1_i1:146-511(-)
MIWLSDVPTPDHGPTHVIPGSHRFCHALNPAYAKSIEADGGAVAATGMAGTAVLVNNQVWHRGCPNSSDVARDTLQLSYGRRIIGHKHKTVMDYNMPGHVLKGRSEEAHRLLGFLQGGAYS